MGNLLSTFVAPPSVVPPSVPPPRVFQAKIKDSGDEATIIITFGEDGCIDIKVTYLKASSDNVELSHKTSVTFIVVEEEREVIPECRDVEPTYTLITKTVYIENLPRICMECSHSHACDCKFNFDLEALVTQARACGFLVTKDADGSSLPVSSTDGKTATSRFTGGSGISVTVCRPSPKEGDNSATTTA